MSVVSIKVPRCVKEKMKKHASSVEWPEEVRKLLIQKIEELERADALERVVKILEDIPSAPRGTAEKLVRRDRESH
jgi:hypothetical protein